MPRHDKLPVNGSWDVITEAGEKKDRRSFGEGFNYLVFGKVIYSLNE